MHVHCVQQRAGVLETTPQTPITLLMAADSVLCTEERPTLIYILGDI